MFKTLSLSTNFPDLGVLSSADFEDEETSILNYQKAYSDFLKLYAKVNRLKVPFSDEAFQEYKQPYKHNKLINKNSYYISEFSKINLDPVHDELKFIANYFHNFDIDDDQAQMYLTMTQCLNTKYEQLFNEVNSHSKKNKYKRRNHTELNQDSVNAKKPKSESQTPDKFKLTEELIAFVNKYSDERPAKIASRLKTKFNIPVNIELKAEIEALVYVSK